MKNEHWVFDYDNTLAEKGGKIQPKIAQIIRNQVLHEKKIAIITSRSMQWIRKNKIEILDNLFPLYKIETRNLKKIAKNFTLYCGRGNEKFFLKVRKNKLVLVEDSNYCSPMSMDEVSKIQTIIKKELPPKAFQKNAYSKHFFSNDSKGIIRSIIKVSKLPKKEREKMIQMIRSKLNETKDKNLSQIHLDMDEEYLSFGVKNKSSAIKDILKNNPNKKVYYYGDSPEGNDRPILDISKKELIGQVKFIHVKSPVHTLSLIQKEQKNSVENNNLDDILKVLLNEEIKNNIQSRLENYWRRMGLPNEWIDPLIKTLRKNNQDENLAAKEARKKFPQLVKSDGNKYSAKLKSFRKLKVQNLAKRIKKYIRGGVIADIGGRKEDLVEEIMRNNKDVKNAYVTDIGNFEETSKNEKVKFIVQPSLTELPFLKGTIDTSILSLVLHHLSKEDQEKMIESTLFSLKDGGRIILIEDSYSESDTFKSANENIKSFMRFNSKNRKRILSFYDWFGNKITRNRDNVPLTFNYRTMEKWKELFEKKGAKLIKSEFIKKVPSQLDLFPPKAFMIFEK